MNEDYYDKMMQKRCGSLKGCAMSLVGIVVLVLLCLLCSLTSCTTTKYVPVETNHTEHHWHTDSIKEVDSVIREKQTTIMQLDSAQMAKYGIQLKNAERAWLVKSWELEHQIEQLQKLSAIRDTVRDSIQVPYPIEKKLTKWQQAKVDWGGWAMLAVLIISFITVWLIIKRLQRQG